MDSTSLQKTSSTWDLFPTIGFSVLIMGLFVVAQTIGLFIGLLMKAKADNPDNFNLSLDGGELIVNDQALTFLEAMTGDTVAFAALLSGLLGSLAILAIIRLKKNARIVEYLHLKKPLVKPALLWSGGMLGFVFIGEILPQYIESLQTDFMKNLYFSSNNLPLLYLGVGVVAPIFEEFMFRGFLFKGIENSRLGGIGAVIITSIVFALIHTQYNMSIVLLLIPVGLILGFARLKSKSIILPIILHCANNILGIYMTGLEV